MFGFKHSPGIIVMFLSKLFLFIFHLCLTYVVINVTRDTEVEDNTIYDPYFGLAFHGVAALRRDVEFCQWREYVGDKGKPLYKADWSKERLKSVPSHVNPWPLQCVKSTIINSNNVYGEWHEMNLRISMFRQYRDSAASHDGFATLRNHYLHYSHGLKTRQICNPGDIRVSFKFIEPPVRSNKITYLIWYTYLCYTLLFVAIL